MDYIFIISSLLSLLGLSSSVLLVLFGDLTDDGSLTWAGMILIALSSSLLTLSLVRAFG